MGNSPASQDTESKRGRLIAPHADSVSTGLRRCQVILAHMPRRTSKIILRIADAPFEGLCRCEFPSAPAAPSHGYSLQRHQTASTRCPHTPETWWALTSGSFLLTTLQFRPDCESASLAGAGNHSANRAQFRLAVFYTCASRTTARCRASKTCFVVFLDNLAAPRFPTPIRSASV